MRHFAITGIETACWISRIMPGSDMRATPPSRRMSAGTRSSAITAHGAGVLGDQRLLGVDDVHDDAALEHLGEPALDAHRAGLAHAAVLRHAVSVARWLRAAPAPAAAGSGRRPIVRPAPAAAAPSVGRLVAPSAAASAGRRRRRRGLPRAAGRGGGAAGACGGAPGGGAAGAAGCRGAAAGAARRPLALRRQLPPRSRCALSTHISADRLAERPSCSAMPRRR